jgi:hypothetical protein
VEEAMSEQAQGQTSIKQQQESEQVMADDNEIVLQRIGGLPGIPLDTLLGEIATQAEAYIASGHEHAAQVFLLQKDATGYAVRVIAVAPLPEDQTGKSEMAEALGQLVAPFDAYIFLTEAWFVAVESREAARGLIGKVKDQPNRVEVFQLHFVSKQGESRMLDWEILRPEGEKARFGPKRETRNEGQPEGRFANFYLWARTPGEQGN